MIVAIALGVELADTRKYTTRGSVLLLRASSTQVDDPGSGGGVEAQNEATSAKPPRQARQGAKSP